MLRLYFGLGPNPEKVVMLLEELGLPYELEMIDTFAGKQHTPEFRAVNPNAKVPALRDGDAVVWDSTAILLHLAEREQRFIGPASARPELLSWLMFIGTGLGPYSGQAVHFWRVAPEPKEYGINRYRKETARHYQVLEERLTGRDWLVGGEFTIADISAWAWVNRAPIVMGGDEAALAPFPALSAWFARVNARPSAVKTKEIGAAAQLKRDFDEQTVRALFPQNFS